jgi:hypothetical protein
MRDDGLCNGPDKLQSLLDHPLLTFHELMFRELQQYPLGTRILIDRNV